MESVMPFPIKVCAICSEEFELKPDKPGFANRCPECSAMDEAEVAAKRGASERNVDSGLNEARRHAMRDLLYPKE
jgi:tRNA(Ile2) C34 agmatinyltransferase TiaS